MSVSVIIPTRNRLALLQEAIASVERQSYPNWELIVVDDASSDETSGWLRRVSDPRIHTICMGQHGERSAARNRGLQEAVGDWVLFLDDDDRLRPHALAHLVAAFRGHAHTVAAVGARLIFYGRKYSQRSPHPRFRHICDAWPDVLFGWVSAQGQALLRKSVLLEAGGWNEHLALAEDHELWLRLVRLGPVVTIPDIVLEVRVHPGQSPRIGLPGRTRDFRAAFVEKLSPELRARGEATLEACRCNMAGQTAFRLGYYKLALALYSRAIRRAPFLVRSPLSGPHILGLFLKSLAGSVFGSRAVGLVRRFKQYARTVIRRDVYGAHSNRSPYGGKEV